ncbi:cupin-like domain-containing protein [Bacillus mojavensis]|uniref:cupin-like domain-containing protein n=1 Tax=Bacillus mojavensis TaxID=72360 RepID=UPI002DB6B10A|nr:cupin-like domain-containing protein [Bacillus mojavensis]MEC1291557.1 cupin-like domain-containing protein [Bacillus mojavensis]MEC1705396.1 cupin-like domain-containing protein [Bacillus mojavensis]MEC5245554.1 cupin-like domain-containing protein [Bacillus mojavensis]
MEKKLSHHPIDRRVDLTYDEFMKEYGLPGKPVIISDAINNWEAKKLWTLDFFREKYGHIIVPIFESGKRYELYETTLGEYIDYILKEEQEDGIFNLADWEFSRDCPELRDHYHVPDYFQSWLEDAPISLLPALRWIYINQKDTGSGLHIDYGHTASWNAVISGKKKWILLNQNESENIYNGAVDAFNPDFKKFPLYTHSQTFYGEQSEGDIMYIPSGWWHQVHNEELTIAVTENFINETNYKNCLWPLVSNIVEYQLEISKTPGKVQKV